PVPDRLRVVSDANQNLRINVDNGFVTTDGTLNPTGSAIAAAAYTNSVAGSTATLLYGIDITGDRLVLQSPPNDGVLTNAGSLGFDATGVGGFDVLSTRNSDGTFGSNTSFAALTVGDVTKLYSINLSSGAPTELGTIGDGTITLRGLSAQPADPANTAYTIDANTGNLWAFSTDTPGITNNLGPITGLAAGQTIIGFDFRPNTGKFYVVTKDASNAGGLYVLDPATREATGFTAITGATLDGTSFGVDFNPTNNALRLVSNTGQNLAISVESGTASVQTPLNGASTSAVNAAYSNNFVAATSTTLYLIDSSTNAVYTQVPGSGVTTLVGALGVDPSAIGGFDIAANGRALATLTVGGQAALYSINLSTGQATAVGNIGFDGDTLGFAIAPSGSLQFNAPGIAITNEVAGFTTLTITRVGGTDGAISVLVKTIDGTARAGGDYTSISQIVTFGPGVTTGSVDVPITQDTRFEVAETFQVLLSPAGGNGLVDQANNDVLVTINDDEPTLLGLDGANNLL
ncbi:MAG: DUF4394 domain-containing protein, partial [Verrucomicrobiaceae bacterium]